MRIFTSLVGTLLLAFAFSAANAQILPAGQPEQNPCTPLLLCNSYTTAGAYQGHNPIADSLPPSCIPSLTAAVFWQVTIAQSGLFMFTLTPGNACDDYDWAVYKVKHPELPCPYDLSSDTLVRCDANDIYNSPGGLTGLSTAGPPGVYYQGAGAGPAFLVPINAIAGETYLIVINNAGTYGCPPGTPDAPVTVSFGNSTAIFADSLKPRMQYITPSCNQNQQVLVHMNKPIKCSSIAANGSDFSISPNGTVSAEQGTSCATNSTTQDILVSFASPLAGGNYVLSVQVGTDNNNLLDICDSPVVMPDTLQFYVNPYTPISYTGITPPTCTEVRMGMNDRVNCDSIAVDGSDYMITGPETVSIVGAYGIACDSLHFTDSIVLLLSKPILTDGTYTIFAQKGSDGNTQVDSCGIKQNVKDSTHFVINSFDGQVTVTPHYQVLCETGYMQLQSANTVIPPDSLLLCGTNGDVCPGVNVHFAVGKGTKSNINSPFYGYGQSRMQYLYTAKELIDIGMKPGSIQSIAYQVTGLYTGSITYSNFTIKMGCTGASQIQQAFLPGLSVVYSAPTYNSTLGWNVFNLSTPFNWDGKTNIVIEICDNNGTSAFNADQITSSVTNFPSVYHLYTYNGTASTDGCAMVPGAGINVVNNYTTRPKTRFSVCPAPTGDLSQVVTHWTPSAYISSAFDPSPRIFALSTMLYTATVVDRNGCPHRDTSSIIVSVRHPFIRPDKDTAICIGDTIHLSTGGAATYRWFSNTADTVACGTCDYTYSLPVQSTKFSVVAADIYNCADTLSEFVTVHPSPLVRAIPRDTTILYGSSIQLLATGASTYIWSPTNSLDYSLQSGPVATVFGPVHFTVIGIDTNGCHSYDTSFIGVIYRNPIFVPSGFTPNGDGKNDRFRVAGLTFQKVIEFRVFNRWGQEVFNADSNSGWDGTFNGSPADIGVYKYLIRVVSPDGYLQEFKGDVTLIR